MTAKKPSPYRCETCKHNKPKPRTGRIGTFWWCEIAEWYLDACSCSMDGIGKDFIAKVGCASHSTLQQEPAPVECEAAINIRFCRHVLEAEGKVEQLAAAAIAKDREHTLWLLTRNGYKGAEAFLKREFDGRE